MALVAWYPLNGDTNDYSGNGVNAVNSGATVNNSGKVGNCYSFSQMGADGINIPSTNFTNLKNDYSMALWINPAGSHKNYNGAFISSGNWNATSWSFGISQDNSQIDVLGRGYNTYITCPISINTWTHIACVVKDDVTKLYVNGIYYGQRSVNSMLVSDASNTFIGRETYANGHFSFNGKLNDIRIFNHTLSDREVKEISKARILHYKFDNPAVNNIIADNSGFNNHAIINPSTSPVWTKDSKLGEGAYYFNGVNDFIQLGYPKSFSDFTNCTISFWRKNDNLITNWLPFTGQTTSFYIMATSAGTGVFYHSSAGSPKIYKDGVYTSGAEPFTDNQWHHYVITNLNISTWTAIKLSGYGGLWNCEGYFDDVRLYNTELSDNDIKELYNTRASVDDKGNMFVGQINSKGFSTNILDYSSWVVGSTGTQGGRFAINGTTAENQIVVDENPWGQLDVVWQANGNDVTYDADGGWNANSYPIDKTKLYRYSVWLRRKVVGNGTAYLGCQGSTVYNISANTVNTNPYFWHGGISDTEWRLLVAYVLPYNTTHTSGLYEDAGIYRGGTKISTIDSFKWSPTATVGGHRSYLFYSTLPATNQQFYRPRMDIVDGTEPSLEDLLNGNEHRSLIDESGEYDFNKFRLEENGTLNMGEIYEVGMPIRYIRDSMNGSSANTGNHWVEIEAYNPLGNNMARGKSATSTLLTDGNTASSPYYGLTSGVQTVEVDLGEVQIIDYLNIRHYYADGRTYYYIKTEVSADGINWETIFDSELDGRYPETPDGKIILCKSRKFSMSEKGDIFLNELKEGMI